MKTEAIIKELGDMQKDLREMKRYMSMMNTRYNYLNHRVNTLKRRLSITLRNKQAQTKAYSKDDRQLSLGFKENNEKLLKEKKYETI